MGNMFLKVKEATSDNNHWEARILASEIVGAKFLAKKYKILSNYCNECGYTPEMIGIERGQIDNELGIVARKMLNGDDLKRLEDSL